MASSMHAASRCIAFDSVIFSPSYSLRHIFTIIFSPSYSLHHILSKQTSASLLLIEHKAINDKENAHHNTTWLRDSSNYMHIQFEDSHRIASIHNHVLETVSSFLD